MTTDTLHTHLRQGTAAYRRATLALFCAGFATFAMLYCVQPLLPLLAAHFAVSAATSSLALSLTTLCLALCLLVSGALAESWGRKPVMAAALGLASLLGLASVLVDSWQLLLALRALLGLALSGLPALAMAYVGEEFEPESLPAACSGAGGCRPRVGSLVTDAAAVMGGGGAAAAAAAEAGGDELDLSWLPRHVRAQRLLQLRVHVGLLAPLGGR